MSYDLKLPTLCSHVIFWELGAMDTDLRSLRVSKPIAASKLTVRMSGNIVPESKYIIVYDIDFQGAIDNTRRKIYFNEELKASDDFFEIKYITNGSNCPKCQDMKALDDIQYSNLGDLRLARDEYLLIQNVEKYVVTEIGSNIFHNWMGTGLIDLIGTKIMDVNYIKAKITQEVNATLNKFKTMQQEYLTTNRPFTDGEQLDTIDMVSVAQSNSDPSIFQVTVTVTAVSGKSVDFTQYLQFKGFRARG
jgi:excinuclease UvrABC ATPase subunit